MVSTRTEDLLRIVRLGFPQKATSSKKVVVGGAGMAGLVAGCQPIVAGNIQVMAARLNIEERGEGRPAQEVQDVYKKPYTFQLTSPRNSASIRCALAKIGRTKSKAGFAYQIIAHAHALPQQSLKRELT